MVICWWGPPDPFSTCVPFSTRPFAGEPISKGGNGSDSHRIGSGLHFLPYFKSNTDTDSDIVGYECKTDASDSDSNSDIDLIYELTFSHFLY